MPASLSARFDAACAQSSLPDPIIAALLGVSSDDVWEIRNRGVIPAWALPHVRAFTETVESANRGSAGQEDGA
ncbi:transcriptional regulator [Mycobacterium tuberculosis]|nr:transcriptional regulator [Mycobacterium tuberculosis]